MSFNTIVIGADTYASVGNGLYNLNTLGFNDLKDGFKLIPGKRSGAKAPVSASVQRFKEFIASDLSGAEVIVKASCNLQLNVPLIGVTALHVDAMVTDLSTWVTESNLNRLLQGES